MNELRRYIYNYYLLSFGLYPSHVFLSFKNLKNLKITTFRSEIARSTGSKKIGISPRLLSEDDEGYFLQNVVIFKVLRLLGFKK
jgi:hypothetical protein